MKAFWPVALAAALVPGAAVAAPSAAGARSAVATPAGKPVRTVLVELYTSQGCSSCPAADELVVELPRLGLPRERVVPLTFHVSYWDDLGWKDPFAAEAHTQRQMAYSTALAGKMATGGADPDGVIKGPYTPQMVIDGGVHFSGARREVALAEIAKAAQQPAPVVIEGSARAATPGSVAVHARIAAAPGASAGFGAEVGKIGLFAALVENDLVTKVGKGENAGRTLRETAVVRALAGPRLLRAGTGKGAQELDLEIAIPAGARRDKLGVALFVQEMASMKVLGALSVAVN